MKKQLKGFTLIETLVAVLLLATAIAGPLTLASKSLLAAVVAKDQITAFFLAQDAVEYVRFVRDTNKIRSEDWLTGGSSGIALTSCVSADGSTSCYVDTTGNSPAGTPTACSSTCPILRYNNSTKRFTYSTSGTAATAFRRSISITNPINANPDEAMVQVVVSWTGSGGVTGTGCPTGTRCVIVRENIFDWQ